MRCLLPAFAVMAVLMSTEAVGQESSAPPPEMKPLERLLGTWKVEQIVKVPKETRSTTVVVKRELVLGGRFVQATGGFDDKGKPTFTGMYTYDSNRRTYRYWFFLSGGFYWELTGTWDESTQTFTWKGKSQADATGTMTATLRFLDETTFVFSLIARDASGGISYHQEGKAKRTLSRPKTTDDATVIRKLIPAASAMARQDMDKLARSHTIPKASDIEEKSLTLMFLTLPLTDDKEAKEQFRYLTKVIPPPADIAREFYRGDLRVGKVTLSKGPVTCIHADRITDCTCKVDGDVAKGTVSFEVPRLYKGKVEYVAKRKDDKWQIEEFIMSAYGIHVVRNARGMWVTAVNDSRGGE